MSCIFVSDENCDGRADGDAGKSAVGGSPGSFLLPEAESGSPRLPLVLLPALSIRGGLHLSVRAGDEEQRPASGPGQVRETGQGGESLALGLTLSQSLRHLGEKTSLQDAALHPVTFYNKVQTEDFLLID